MHQQDLQGRLEALEVHIEQQRRELDAQRRNTRRAALLMIAAACVALPLASRAVGFVKTDFMSGQPILAAEINTNFANLLSAVKGLEDDVDQLETDVASKQDADPDYSLGATYCGATAGTFSGDINFGALSGYAAAKGICEDLPDCDDGAAHLCTIVELQKTAALGRPIVFTGSSGWIAGAASRVTSGSTYTEMADCEGFTATPLIGSVWNNGIGSNGIGHPSWSTCTSQFPLLCCD